MYGEAKDDEDLLAQISDPSRENWITKNPETSEIQWNSKEGQLFVCLDSRVDTWRFTQDTRYPKLNSQ